MTRGESTRLRVVVDGLVQGVGFRPFVYRVASSLGLVGDVSNGPGGVYIDAQGEVGAIERMVAELTASPPPSARIERITREPLPPRRIDGFRIAASTEGAAPAPYVAPDIAICAACAAEIATTDARRHRHPLASCAHCGPRFTIVTGLPYDRARTTMAGFEMCADCAREYREPSDRRFHAQPIACPACGPRVAARGPSGGAIETGDPIAWIAAHLSRGAIVAIKGLGGYHLACDALDEEAVSRLRSGKERGDKPFAIMAASARDAERWCALDDDCRAALAAPGAPIVLAPTREGSGLAPSVAPGLGDVGVMLPYTPLHRILVDELDGRPLVMTSGNRAGEPMVYRDDRAAEMLGELVQGLLTHDRPIVMRCDDSVARPVAGVMTPVRRARGEAPLPLGLLHPLSKPTLAVGAHMKAAFALGAAGSARAIVSHHLGDLDRAEADRAFRQAVEHYQRLYGIEPARIACDRHPDYATTRYALEQADAGAEIARVQHHHAHLAACLTDAGTDEPTIGVCFDGTGYGDDGAIWGGEWLVGDIASSRRAAHLRHTPLPGGTRAIEQPWRMALAHAIAAGVEPGDWLRGIDLQTVATVTRMIEHGIHAPPTSSIGRLFDAVAAMTGVCREATYDGEPAMKLEALAARERGSGGYDLAVTAGGDGPAVLDPGPAVAELAADLRASVRPGIIARRFHLGLARAVVETCDRLRERTGIEHVALTGGVWINRVLAEEALSLLERGGYRVSRHRRLPPNDGAIGLGQLATVAARDARGAL